MPVKSEKVRLSLVKLQLVEGELARIREDSDMMEAYEGLLMEVQDALQLVQQESTELVRLQSGCGPVGVVKVISKIELKFSVRSLVSGGPEVLVVHPHGKY